MPAPVLSLDAEEDLTGIIDYVAKRNTSAARSLLEQLEATCRLLADNPDLGEIREGFGVPGCRSFSVSRYVIFFRPNSDGVEVARIIDGSRDL
ncbi:MAG: type II toxin-antitoxin system RelE/ParE family toxin [Aureliella sp.]